jgi:hypothetical protein
MGSVQKQTTIDAYKIEHPRCCGLEQKNMDGSLLEAKALHPHHLDPTGVSCAVAASLAIPSCRFPGYGIKIFSQL